MLVLGVVLNQAMKQVFIKQGQAVVEEVPAPVCDNNRILVELSYSLISSGTESAGVTQSQQSLLQRALKQPQNIEKVVKRIQEEGFTRTWQAVQGKLASGMVTGYSCSGIVIEAGKNLREFRPGTAVACAGADKASHAEIVSVPGNLAVSVPEGCALKDAASVALGAIALQGLRRAGPSLGETFAVLGLGLVGQLTVQLLRSAGVRVVGFDPLPARVQRALKLGMTAGRVSDDQAVEEGIRFAEGVGVDATLITAAAKSSDLVNQAMQMTRKKGRVVVVGDVGLELNRSPFYEKEIDLLISCSYGPGRYDPDYEERGHDYPLAYVRWTEKRNMQEYLRLIAEERVCFSDLVDQEFDVSDATGAYELLQQSETRPLAVVLRYPRSADRDLEAKRATKVLIASPEKRKGLVRIGVVGAGGFATGTHLPNLRSLSGCYDLRAVVSRSGPKAKDAATRFGAAYASTDYQDLLRDTETDAVLIVTRHNLHAGMVLEALRAGKHVLVEKPLALNRQELAEIQSLFESGTSTESKPLLLTGFNRRFSPFARQTQEWIQGRRDPMIVNYRMNAGPIALDHWVHGEEGGGRNLGEACHVYDFFTYLTGSRVARVQALAASPRTSNYSAHDNFVATISFADGSLCTLTYTALGSKNHPKEEAEIFVDGQVITLSDYKRLSLVGVRTVTQELKQADKGHHEELADFARAIQEGGDWPIPFWQQVQATEIALQVEELLERS